MLLLPWFLPAMLLAAAIAWWAGRRFPRPAVAASAALVAIAVLLPAVEVGASQSPGGDLAPALRYAAALLGSTVCLVAAVTSLLTVAVVHRSRVARVALLALVALLGAGAAWLLA